MAIRILGVSQAATEQWYSVWCNCNYATYFHSPEWADIWRVYRNNKVQPIPLEVQFSDGSSAILPLSMRSNPENSNNVYISSPEGTYGGWISQDDLTMEHADLLAEFMTKELDALIWRLNPYDGYSTKINMRVAEYDRTYTLSLTHGVDAIFKNSTKTHQQAAKKARRNGICIRMANARTDWEQYYNTYLDSLRRWGNNASSKYTWPLFDDLLQRRSPNIKLWLATHSEEVVAGILCFHAKHHVVHWHSGVIKKYLNLGTAKLLIFEAARNASQQGYHWFDLNPSGGHSGVETFKQLFGSKPLSCPVIVKNVYWRPSGQ